jgi:hypothetical protein
MCFYVVAKSESKKQIHGKTFLIMAVNRNCNAVLIKVHVIVF